MMMRIKQMTSRFVEAPARRLADAADGMAAVEFALIVPIMMVMFMGALEISQAITVDRRVSQVVATTSDLIARAETTVAQAEVNDIMKVGGYLMAPYASTALKVTIRSLSSSATDASDIKEKWRCVYDTAATPNLTCTCQNAAYTPPSGLIAGKSDSVVLGEIEYKYTPWPFDAIMSRTWGSGNGGIYTMKDTSYQKPRGVAAGLTLTSGTTCSM